MFSLVATLNMWMWNMLNVHKKIAEIEGKPKLQKHDNINGTNKILYLIWEASRAA